MSSSHLACAASFALMSLAAVPAAAQLPTIDDAIQALAESAPPRRLTLSAQAGRLAATDWSDTVLLGSVGPAGIVEQVVVRDLGLEPATQFSGGVTYWRGRWGFRAHGAFAASCVRAEGRGCSGTGVNVWLFDAGGAYAFREPRRARDRVAPYAFFDVGAVAYDAERPIGPDVLAPAQTPGAAGRTLVVIDDSDQFLLSLDQVRLEAKPIAGFGLGTDIALPVGSGAIGVRIEVADQISRSPVQLALTRLGRAPFGAPRTRLDFGPVHHFSAMAGIVIGVDLR